MTVVSIDVLLLGMFATQADAAAASLASKRASVSSAAEAALVDSGGLWALEPIMTSLTGLATEMRQRVDLAIVINGATGTFGSASTLDYMCTEDGGSSVLEYTLPDGSDDTAEAVTTLLGTTVAKNLKERVGTDPETQAVSAEEVKHLLSIARQYEETPTFNAAFLGSFTPDEYSSFIGGFSYAGVPYVDGEDIVHLQAQITALTARQFSHLPEDFVTKDYASALAEAEPVITGMIFRNAVQNNLDFDAGFIEGAATKLMEWETGTLDTGLSAANLGNGLEEGWVTWLGTHSSNYGWAGFEPDDYSELIPTWWMLRAAQDSPAESQGLLATTDLASYYLHDYKGHLHDGTSPEIEEALGKIVYQAVIPQSMYAGEGGRTSAEVASRVVYVFGGDAEPPAFLHYPIAEVLSTYMVDVAVAGSGWGAIPDGGTAFDRWSGESSTHPGLPGGLTAEDGFPPYAAGMDKTRIHNLLGDLSRTEAVGDLPEDAALGLLSMSAGALTQFQRTSAALTYARGEGQLEEGYTGVNNVTMAMRETSALEGWMTDAFTDGDIRRGDVVDATAAEQESTRAGLYQASFMAPVDIAANFVPGGVGKHIIDPIGKAIFRQITRGAGESLAEHLATGESAAAIAQAQQDQQVDAGQRKAGSRSWDAMRHAEVTAWAEGHTTNLMTETQRSEWRRIQGSGADSDAPLTPYAELTPEQQIELDFREEFYTSGPDSLPVTSEAVDGYGSWTR